MTAAREAGPAGGPAAKARLVDRVFASVSSRYDLMNDLMSLGAHRIWKREAVFLGDYRPGQDVLDLAGGSGDMTALIAPRVGPGGRVWLSDASAGMLEVGRRRTARLGNVRHVLCRAESLPFDDGSFDRVTVAFGLRNFSDQPLSLREIRRVLRPTGRFQMLEFSDVHPLLSPAYHGCLGCALPLLGKAVAGDADSYRYLADSIRAHPGREEMAAMIGDAGFLCVGWLSLSGGVVAVHHARRGA